MKVDPNAVVWRNRDSQAFLSGVESPAGAPEWALAVGKLLVRLNADELRSLALSIDATLSAMTGTGTAAAGDDDDDDDEVELGDDVDLGADEELDGDDEVEDLGGLEGDDAA